MAKVKKIINETENIVGEVLDGYVAASMGKLRRTDDRVLVRTEIEPGKVGLVIGGFALALVLIFVVFKLVAGGFDAGSGTASHQVPDLLGKTLEEAEAHYQKSLF